MSKKAKGETLFWGLVLLVIGTLFLLDNLGVNIDVWDVIGNYWPLILIGIGLKNIWGHFQAKRQQP